jgi:hypothetical protein
LKECDLNKLLDFIYLKEVKITMKTINLTIFAPDPEKTHSKGVKYTLETNDDATIIDILSEIDRNMIEDPKKSVFPLFKGLIHSYLQLIWDAEENKIYDDCGVDAYGPNKEFMPLRSDIDFSLIPNSNIIITVHAD